MSDKITPRLPTPQAVKDSLSRIAQTGKKLVSDLAGQKARGEGPPVSLELSASVGKAFFELSQKLMMSPQKALEIQMAFWRDYLSLWERTSRRLMGGEAGPPVIEPGPTDKRFKDEEWAKSAVFDFIKQSYLLAARSMQEAVTDVDGLDRKTAERVEFYTKQLVDAMAPTNSIAMNPRVLRETLETGGENLMKGFANFLEDMRAGQGDLRVRMQDPAAFTVGKDLAITKGKVVMRNDLCELIQYAPQTPEVHARPLLFVPPWINKFYVLDLSPKSSFVRYAVSQGFTVFILSWRNPDEALAQKGFEDYLAEGPLAALDAIEAATGQREVAAVGYCLGGTLLTTALAYLAGKGDQRITAATLFTTLTDFSEPGELGVFIDEEQLQALERQMGEKGYLDGGQMAAAFSMLRSNDLIWSFVVHNYLLGRDPIPFDVLYWGSDSTRMPAKMHAYYLRNMYQHNRLREPGGITLLGQPIDLGEIDVPIYFLSCREDYIAPWRTTYLGTQLVRGPVRFVLGGSGHIAGVINPAGSKKYGYATNDATPKTADAWLEGSAPHDGSWWPDWLSWIKATSGPLVPAREPHGTGLTPLGDAPGTYVRVRY